MYETRQGEKSGATSLVVALERVLADLPASECLRVAGELERLKLMALARMIGEGLHADHPSVVKEDRLLTVEEASQKLSMSADYLYRHSAKLPFSVRTGRRQLRFSLLGIERYIRERQGR